MAERRDGTSPFDVPMEPTFDEFRRQIVLDAGYNVDIDSIDRDPLVKQRVLDVINGNPLTGTPTICFVLGGGYTELHVEFGGEIKKFGRSSLYEESDRNGSLGGIFRVKAAAAISKALDHNILIIPSALAPTSTYMAQELALLGVPSENIVEEPNAQSSFENLVEALRILKAQDAQNTLIDTSEYHRKRVMLSLERIVQVARNTGRYDDSYITEVQHLSDTVKTNIRYPSAEEILTAVDPAFAIYFEAVKQTPEYRKREVSEGKGIINILDDTYVAGKAKPTYRSA